MRTSKLMSLTTAVALAAVLSVGTAGPSLAAVPLAAGSATAASVVGAVTAANPFEQVPVTGTLKDGTGSVTGVVDITRFQVKRDGHTRTLYAIGTFTGQIIDSTGTVHPGSQQIALPVDVARSGAADEPHGLRSTSALAAAPPGGCDILTLVLGPLDLNVLGLEVHLKQVILDIVAQSGAGNLLGNLLCAVAGLLNGASAVGGLLNGIAALLNRLVAILG